MSNTAVAYGGRILLKIFRRPEPGPHTEVEALHALTRQPLRPHPHTLRRAAQRRPSAEGLVLEPDRGVPARRPRRLGGGGTAGGRLATALAAPARPAGGFTARAWTRPRWRHDARALGKALRPQPPLGTGREEAARVNMRLKEAAEEVPALARYTTRLGALFDDYARVAGRRQPRLRPAQHPRGSAPGPGAAPARRTASTVDVCVDFGEPASGPPPVPRRFRRRPV
ncbi:hypothetical protein ACRAWF_02020 [Streptomyces sp. L7]